MRCATWLAPNLLFSGLLLWSGSSYAQIATSSTSSVTATSTSGETISAEEARLLEEAFGSSESSPTSRPPPPSSGPAAFMTSMMQTLNPAMSVILDVAGSYFTTEEPLQLGGHDPNRTGFTFQQLELHLEANVDPFFRFDANIVFAEFGVEVEEAYATTLKIPGNLQFRAGQFLTRFGRINPTHPHSWSFTDQPIVNGKFFGSEGSRGLGIEASWLAPLPWYLEIVGSGGSAAGECCARSFQGGDDIGIRGPQDLLYTTALKQFFPLNDDWSIFWGLSAQLGPNSTGNGNRTEIYGTDLYIRFRPIDSAVRAALSWQTEASFRTRQVPDDSLRDFGLYSQLVWNMHLRWETALRYEYVSGVDNDPLDPDWTEARQRISGQLTFYPSHFSRIRAQVNWDDPQFLNESYWGFILGLEVLVGAHGAHNY